MSTEISDLLDNLARSCTVTEFLEVVLDIKPLPASLRPQGCWKTLNAIEAKDSVTDRFKEWPATWKKSALAALCANYLPKVVEGFLNPPFLNGLSPEERRMSLLDNAHMRVLAEVAFDPYFLKYLQSGEERASHGCEVLAQALIERFLDVAQDWDAVLLMSPSCPTTNADCSHETLQKIMRILCPLISVLNKETPIGIRRAVPPAFVDQLALWFCRWSTYTDKCVGQDAEILSIYLAAKPFGASLMRQVREECSGRAYCALPGCAATENLEACNRCGTVRYCSDDHQKKDWQGAGLEFAHKDCCFLTIY